MEAVSEDMLVDVVDERDQPTGVVAPRREVLPRRLNFRVVHLFLFNKHGHLLLQRLSQYRTRHPRHWGSSVAGYVFSGERYEEAAERRLVQELGVSEADLHLYARTAMNDEGSKKFIALFLATHEGALKPDPRHIEHVEYFEIDKIRTLLRRAESPFTPTFRHVFQLYDRRRGEDSLSLGG